MYKGIRTWEQLREAYRLKEVLAAVKNRDDNRAYHQARMLKSQEILRRAKELGITRDDEGSYDWNFNPPAIVKRPGLFRRIWYRIFSR